MSAQNTAGEETFLTVAEVAAILRLNPQTVRNWIDQGTLPAIRMGRRVRIKRSDFERVVEQSYRSGGANNGPNAEDFWGGTPVGADPDDAVPVIAADSQRPAGPGAADPQEPGPAAA